MVKNSLHLLAIKGIAHQKFNSVIIYSPCTSCMNVFVLLNTKQDILKKVGNSSFEAPLILMVFFPTMEVNGAPKQPGYKLLQNIFLCVQQNKDILTGLELLEGE